MAGGIDQIQRVDFSVSRLIGQCGSLRLDGDATLTLQCHGAQDLGLHLAIRESATQLDDAIGERAFAMVDVGNN